MCLEHLSRLGTTLAICLMLVGAGPQAAQAPYAQAPAPSPQLQAAPRVLSGARVGTGRGFARTVVGVWDSSNQPVPGARLRLRHVVTGRIAATGTSDTAGRITFGELEGGSYVAEVLAESGRILAVGQPFGVSPGETVTTFVRLGAKAPWFAGLFKNTAAAVAASAAAVGVTAIAPNAKPCASPSPGCD